MATIYKVSGMKCHGCEIKIEDALKKEGISAKADKDKGTVSIEVLNKNPKVQSIIESLGFSVN